MSSTQIVMSNCTKSMHDHKMGDDVFLSKGFSEGNPHLMKVRTEGVLPGFCFTLCWFCTLLHFELHVKQDKSLWRELRRTCSSLLKGMSLPHWQKANLSSTLHLVLQGPADYWHNQDSMMIGLFLAINILAHFSPFRHLPSGDPSSQTAFHSYRD